MKKDLKQVECVYVLMDIPEIVNRYVCLLLASLDLDMIHSISNADLYVLLLTHITLKLLLVFVQMVLNSLEDHVSLFVLQVKFVIVLVTVKQLVIRKLKF